MRYFLIILSVTPLFYCSSKPANLQTNQTHSVDQLDIKLNDWGTPIQVKGELLAMSNTEESEKSIIQYMVNHKSIFKLENPAKELAVQKNIVDDLGFRHVRFSRRHKGIPVFGNEIIFHINQDKIVYLMQGDYVPSLSIGFRVKPKLAKSAAIEKVKAETSFKTTIGDPELFIYPKDNKCRLTWRIIASASATSVEQWECFIDARIGDLVYTSSLIRY